MFYLQRLTAIAIFSSSIMFSNITSVALADLLPSENQCSTKAYVIDPSENGLNVRFQPSSSGKVLGRLPKSTVVNVLGMQGNWILISVLDPSAQKVFFRRKGWVYGSLLGVSVSGYERKTVNLYSRPSLRSMVSAKVSPSSSTTILGCSGKWLRVETKNHQQKGWLEPNQQCASAETSCS
jgi:SH3-like domain-containing protein